MRSLLASLALVAVTGCATTGPVAGMGYLDPNAGTECVEHCGSLGMKLSAVVLIMQHSGCVCAPADAPASSQVPGAAAAAGGAAIQLAVQAQQQSAPQVKVAGQR